MTQAAHSNNPLAAQLDASGFIPDSGQQQVIALLQTLSEQLAAPRPTLGFVDKLLKRKAAPIVGLYIWGGVGRGKTHLMDVFFNHVAIEHKQRLHFHRFMQHIHQALQQLPKSPDPLSIVARDLAQHTQLLCLDEFHVNDIGDAMLLGRLLAAMFDQGITLVTTSNIRISDLYKTGLQRERFLPAIELLHEYTHEAHLDGDTDYRTRLLEQAGSYYICPTGEGHATLQTHFSRLAAAATPAQQLNINHRVIDSIAEGEDVVWFDFHAICDTPRSAADYLEIARLYHTVLISDIPILGEAQDSAAQRFIHLIDAFYDHSVKIVITAEASAIQLYTGQRHQFAFDRTISRLQEMASHEYLAQPHRA